MDTGGGRYNWREGLLHLCEENHPSLCSHLDCLPIVRQMRQKKCRTVEWEH